MSKLTSTLRDVLTTTDLADPALIADEMLSRLGPDDRQDALRDAFNYWVRAHVSRQREGVPGELIGHEASGSTPVAERSQRPAQNLRRSKAALTRDWWAEFLNERVHVGGEWKLTGDCTVTDVEFLVRERREIAARNTAAANRYAALLERMRREGADTVRGLDRLEVRDLAA